MDGWWCTVFMGEGRFVKRSVFSRINYLELEMVFLALKKFQRWLSETHIQTDNITVVPYLSRMRGTRSSSLDQLSRRIILWCLASKISLRWITFLAFRSRILPDWSVPQNGLWIKREPFCSLVFGANLQ